MLFECFAYLFSYWRMEQISLELCALGHGDLICSCWQVTVIVDGWGWRAACRPVLRFSRRMMWRSLLAKDCTSAGDGLWFSRECSFFHWFPRLVQAHRRLQATGGMNVLPHFLLLILLSVDVQLWEVLANLYPDSPPMWTANSLNSGYSPTCLLRCLLYCYSRYDTTVRHIHEGRFRFTCVLRWSLQARYIEHNMIHAAGSRKRKSRQHKMLSSNKVISNTILIS